MSRTSLKPHHRPTAGLSLAVALAVAGSPLACGGATAVARRHGGGIGPTTAPAALPDVARLADAKPLTELTGADHVQANWTDKLSAPQVGRSVYFGEVDEYDGDDEDATLLSSLPVLGVKDGTGDWRAVPLVGQWLADAGWRYVGAGPGRGEVWGVLDTSAGASGPDFVVAHSTDGGATFHLATIPKPCRPASVFDFAMSHAGRGRVTLALDATCGSSKPGLYHYETADGGQTWSAHPRFEPDAMTRADSVPDAEQPDAGDGGGHAGKSSKTGLRGRATVIPIRGRLPG